MGWLTGWSYRKEVTLVEQSSGDYNDYPTIITVAYDAHMKNDFADCRFTESDGTTLISYGIVEKTDGVSCAFVIKRNYTSDCTLDVYLYYGNPDAADASVDHGPWALAWYLANGFGQSTSAYTDTNCAAYPHSASEAIPAWAAIAFGGCTANGGYRAFTGRAKINGVAVAWASTVICNGITTAYQLKWKKYNCATSQYDHASFVAGASNTVTWGHYQSGNPGFWVSYYPTDPSVSLGAEEEETVTIDLLAKFEAQATRILLGKTIIRHMGIPVELLGKTEIKNADTTELLGKGVVKNIGSTEFLGKAEIQQSGSAEFLGKAVIRHAGIPVDLPARFEIGQDSADLYSRGIIKNISYAELLSGLVVRHSITTDLLAKFEAQATRILLGKTDVQQSGSAELLGEFEAQVTAELFSKFEVGQDSVDLLAKFEAQTTLDLLGRVDITHSVELLGKTVIRHPAYPLWLRGKFSVRLTNAYRDLGSILRIIRPASLELISGFAVRRAGISVELLGRAIIRRPDSAELLARFEAQATAELLGKADIKEPGSADLDARMIIGPAKGSDIYIAPLDPSGWINEVMGIGRGFIVIPWVEADSVITRGSYSSARLTSTYAPGQYKEIKFGWCGMGWGFEVGGLTPDPIDTDGGGPRRDSRGQGDQRREVPQDGFRELGTSFSLTRKGFNELAASLDVIGVPPFYDFHYYMLLGIDPWATSIGTDWETVMEFYWPLAPETSDTLLFIWDAQIRAWAPGAEYYVKITLQQDGDAKFTLWMESGSNPASGWMWDGLAAGIFPISLTRTWGIPVGDYEKPWTVRVEMKSTQSIDVFWQCLTGVIHGRRDWP